MEKPRITADELAQKLVGAKKIMKKVDNGDFEKGAVNENVLRSNPEELMVENAPTVKTTTKPVGTVDPRRVNNSKLPENIKKAMIENPIPQIGLNDGLDMSMDKAKQLMVEDGQYVPSTESQILEAPTSAPTAAPSKPTTMKISASDLTRTLTPIIENIIRKTMDDILDKKLTQILTASETQTINEGLAIKVGDTIFTGKLTKAKNIK